MTWITLYARWQRSRRSEASMEIGDFGFAELLIVLLISLAIAAAVIPRLIRPRAFQTSFVGSAGSDGSYAIPDLRYTGGAQLGAVAQLLGLGPMGIRWSQVLGVLDGIWLSA